MEKDNNKRIVKNTLLLYFRILLTTLVTLYTARVVLRTLGVVDYGVFGVLGSVVTSFAFLSAVMTSASQRFFAFELGSNNLEQLKKTFNTTFFIFVAIAIIALILAETVGLWFFYNKLIIPAERMSAAFWVYQFAVLSFMVTILKIPYSSVIIARENMQIFAGISIFEAVLKLLLVCLLVFFDYDKLKLYAILMFCSTFLVFIINKVICNKKYEESQLTFTLDKTQFKTILSYSGWNLFGALTNVLSNQGINILLNVFFGPAINAARTIAYQINNAVEAFSQNFYTALNPQIIKSYALKELNRTFSLVFSSSKFAFYLLLMLSMPIILETRLILEWWLGEINEYMVVFTRLVLIFSLVNVLENPLTQVVRATGKLKLYQICVGILALTVVPVSYILYKFGYPEYTVFVVMILIYFMAIFIRLGVLKKMINFPVKDYIIKVLLMILVVSLFSTILPVGMFLSLSEGFIRFFVVAVSSVLSMCCIAYFLGMSKNEKKLIISFLKIQSKK